MTEVLYGAQYVAAHLGVTTATIHHWSMNLPEGFPEADFIGMAHKDRVIARLWRKDNLPVLRAWVAKNRRWSDERAEMEWKRIDDAIASGGAKQTKKNQIHPDQMAIEVAS